MFCFEKALLTHCSPTMAALKPANLLSLSKEQYPDLPRTIAQYAPLFSSRGIQMQIVCSCGQRWLLLLFRPELLEQSLSQRGAKLLLKGAGYPVQPERPVNLSQMLLHLTKRLGSQDHFPHEIGLFLGYPLEDVVGFCRHRGEGCKLCGYWKVYGDAQAARARFARYDHCRERLLSELLSGQSLRQIVDALPAA